MIRGQIRFAVVALAVLVLCSHTSASAQFTGCISDKYEGQRESSASLLFITEFNISAAQPVNLCPQRGAYYRQSGYLAAARSLPAYFWFRLEGDRSFTSSLIGRNVSVLKLRAMFERHVVGDTYAPFDGGELEISSGVSMADADQEATGNEATAGAGNVTSTRHGLFDWRGHFLKERGLHERGGYRLKLVVEGHSQIRIVCGRLSGCQPDSSQSGQPAWLEFFR